MNDTTAPSLPSPSASAPAPDTTPVNDPQRISTRRGWATIDGVRLWTDGVARWDESLGWVCDYYLSER